MIQAHPVLETQLGDLGSHFFPAAQLVLPSMTQLKADIDLEDKAKGRPSVPDALVRSAVCDACFLRRPSHSHQGLSLRGLP